MVDYSKVQEGDTYNIKIPYKRGVVVVDKRENQLELERRIRGLNKKYIANIYVSHSSTTESVYGLISFRKRKEVFSFGIKNHHSFGNSTSKLYLYKDYNNLDNLINKLEKDIDRAYKTRSFCLDTRLCLVEYQVLRRLSEGLVLKVQIGKYKEMVNFKVYKGIDSNIEVSIPNLNIAMIRDLYARKMLMELKNRPVVEELVLSKLAHLSLVRVAPMFDSNGKFTNLMSTEGLYA